MNTPAIVPSTTAPAPLTQQRLENGLTLIHQFMPATDVVTADVWVNAGAVREPDEWNGMAHFLEHMIFKGTEEIGPGVFDAAIETVGGMTNAATSHDYAHFYLTVAADHLDQTLPYLGALLTEAAIPDHEFDRERQVVLEEILQSYDDPDSLAFQALSEQVYQVHPYGRPILGTEESLMGRSPDEMRQFHRSHYQPDNVTVVLVGNVELNAAIDYVSRTFGRFAPPHACPQSQPESEPPIAEIRRQELHIPRIEEARLLLAWLAPGIDSPLQGIDAQLQTAYGLDMISVLLTGGRTSHLTRELREERGLVYDISSGFSLQKESGLFTITAWLEDQELERVEAIICDRLSQLAATPLSPVELDRCKRLLCNDYAFSTETPSQMASLYGYYAQMASPEVALEYPQHIQAITAEDLQRLAQQYLSPYRYAATLVKPV